MKNFKNIVLLFIVSFSARLYCDELITFKTSDNQNITIPVELAELTGLINKFIEKNGTNKSLQLQNVTAQNWTTINELLSLLPFKQVSYAKMWGDPQLFLAKKIRPEYLKSGKKPVEFFNENTAARAQLENRLRENFTIAQLIELIQISQYLDAPAIYLPALRILSAKNPEEAFQLITHISKDDVQPIITGLLVMKANLGSSQGRDLGRKIISPILIQDLIDRKLAHIKHIFPNFHELFTLEKLTNQIKKNILKALNTKPVSNGEKTQEITWDDAFGTFDIPQR